MDEKLAKAFDFAQETTKQLLALATGIIAITITFAKDFIGSVPPSTKPLALWAWGGFLSSVVFGIWTLMALTGELDAADTTKTPSVSRSNVVIPAVLQIFTFLAGLILTVIFASCSVG